MVLLGNSALLVPVSTTNRRRIFWTGWGLAAFFFATSIAFRGWAVALATGAAVMVSAVLFAYSTTTYIKIGGRIRSPYIKRTGEEPPFDAYREVATAGTVWWCTAALSLLAGGTALITDRPNEAVLLGALIVSAVLVFTGHLDKADGFPVAREHHAPFAITVIACIPLLLLPIAAYFAAYWASPRKGAGFDDTE
ncbi:MAG: hypothetical protein WBB07_00840 [Mycobacterium sp.]